MNVQFMFNYILRLKKRWLILQLFLEYERIKKGEVIIPNNRLVSVYISIAHNGITRFYNTGLKTVFPL